MYCPNCGKEYSDGQNYCRYCGYSLAANNNIEEVIDMQNDSVQDNKMENDKISPVDLNENKSRISSAIIDEDDNEAYNKFIDKKNRLTPKAIAIITITIVCMLALALILFSIDVETQIGGSSSPVVEETNSDFEINTPADEENSIYAKEPVDVESHAAVQIVNPVEPPVINEPTNEDTELSVQEPDFHYADEPHNDVTDNHTKYSESFSAQDRTFEPQTDDNE